MGDVTEISWATSTFNVRWGCTRVSPACDHCYAEALAKRYGHDVWGADAGRREMSEHYWNEPLRWERRAATSGEPWRVFCSSMADVFEEAPPALAEQFARERDRLWGLIEATPHLTWMLLTKRPQNVLRMVPGRWVGQRHSPDGDAWACWPPNCWVGTTTEDQPHANVRVPRLLTVPAPVRFVSCEPLLGPVDLSRWLSTLMVEFDGADDLPSPFDQRARDVTGNLTTWLRRRTGLGWVIVGGESGPGARPMHPDWARALQDQAVGAGVPFHFKQWGEWADATGREFPLHKAPPMVAISPEGFLASPFDPDRREGDAVMARVGKKAAGRELDGQVWAEFPA